MLSQSNSKKALQSLFYPKSIAVIGASEDKIKIGGFIFSQILKVPSIKAYPINMKSNKIQGILTYPHVSDIKKSVDLAIIVIPPTFVLETIDDCVRSGIKNIVIITAGFKETGDAGSKVEEEIKDLAKKHNINIVGPNCLGFLNPEINLNASFAKDLPEFGNLALVSQSGAVIDALVDWSFSKNIGFSKIISCGNMAGVNTLDFLDYLYHDEKTDTICFYMETIENGEEFGKLLRKVTKKKKVIIIKPGKSENAQKAIGSHTGSLAQNGILVEKLIRENGGIYVEKFEELYNLFIGFRNLKVTGKKTVIVTNAGGPGVITTDALENSNLELFYLSQKQKNIIMESLPSAASANNPIDVLGDAKGDRYINALKEIEKIKDVDNILVLLTPQMMTPCLEIAKELVEFSKKSKKCVSSVFLGGFEIREALEYFENQHFPNFRTPSEAITTLSELYDYEQFDFNDVPEKFEFNSQKVAKVTKEIINKKELLSYSLTKKVFSCIELDLPEKSHFNSKQEILSGTLKANVKYVLKAEGIVHKKEVEAVKVGITSLNFQEEALAMFERTKGSELTLEKQVSGHEVIVGLQQNDLGKFIMFGMGGSYVDVFNDVHFSLAPISYKKAKSLIKESKVYQLLKGVRGEHPINFEALVEILVRVSYIQVLFPEIKEVDLNPIICNKDNAYCVDVKLLK
jgi:acetyltransferase